MNCLKRLPLSNLHNCRDMGGYGCENGNVFSYNKLIRSDVPNELTREEWNQLIARGVRTVIDLRSEGERIYMPYTAPDEIEIFQMPMQQSETDFMKSRESSELAAVAFARSLSDMYGHILFSNTSVVADILNTTCSQLEKGGVLFHCSVGKDRTGILAALIYILCGVAEVDIIADYQVTETYIAGKSKISSLLPAGYEKMLESKAETMQDFLRQVKAQEGIRLLYENGLDEEKVGRLKEEVY